MPPSTPFSRSRPSGPGPTPIASMPFGPQAKPCLPWPASPWGSRTTSAPRAFPPPAPAGCWSTLCPPTRAPSPSGSGRPAQCCWAKPISTSSPWAARPKPPPSGRAATPGTPSGCPAAVPVAVRRPWRPVNVWRPWGQTPAARSASPPLSAVWWASSPPTGGSAATGWWPSPAPSTRWAPSAPAWPMRPSCCR